MFKKRLQVFCAHLMFSLLLLSIALTLVYVVWYPDPLASAMGVMKIYMIMLAIDVIVGPILTALVYKKNKKLFLFNVIVILLLQLSAYFYGLYTVAQGRPAFMVFVVDDIELVSPVDVSVDRLGENIAYHMLSKPLWIASTYSDDPKISDRQRSDEITNGNSIATEVSNYQPLEWQSHKVKEKLRSLDELRVFNSQDKLDRTLSQHTNAIGWLPVKAPEIDKVALFDENAYPIVIVDLNPWDVK